MARTKEEKEIAHQRRKAKEAEANMDGCSCRRKAYG